MSWLYLACAVLLELVATLSLRQSDGLRDKRWAPVIVGGYLLSFGFLALTLDAGMAIGVAYGIWAATGVALTAIAARFLFRDPLTKTMGAGIALIACGVLLIEVGAHG